MEFPKCYLYFHFLKKKFARNLVAGIRERCQLCYQFILSHWIIYWVGVYTHRMQNVPRPPLRLSLFSVHLRHKDVPVTAPQWKTAMWVCKLAIFITTFAMKNVEGSFVAGALLLEHTIEVANLKFGPWGKFNEGIFYCNVYTMIVAGNNVVQIIFLGLAEALLKYFTQNLWGAMAIVLFWRFDSVRFQFPEPTEQAYDANDLEALHSAQPPRPPNLTIDTVYPFLIAICAFTKPLVMLHLFLRALLILARDLGSVSAIQHELYNDVLSTVTIPIAFSV